VVPLALHRQLYRGGYKTVLTCGDIKDCPSDSQVHWLACNAAIIVTKLLESHLFRRDYLRMPCPSSATSQQFDMVVCCRLLIKVLSEVPRKIRSGGTGDAEHFSSTFAQHEMLLHLNRGTSHQATQENGTHLACLAIQLINRILLMCAHVYSTCRTPNWCFVRSSRLPLQSSSTNDILANALLTSLPAKI